MSIYGDVYSKAESPIEHEFWHGMEKHFRGDRAESQVWVCGGRYRLDSLLSHQGHRIAVELDGAMFHTASGDAERDRKILLAGEADQIVRITGRAITYAKYACFAVLQDWYPLAFQVPEDAYFEVLDAIALGGNWQEIVGERQMFRRGQLSSAVSQGPLDSDWITFVGHEVRRRISARP